MPQKTIYVSETDAPIFEDAKTMAGEALSSVIVRALKEYISRHTEKTKGMKEVSVKVGIHSSEREKRFIGKQVGEWNGFSNDKIWFLTAKIYHTQKGSWAVYLVNVCKSSLLTNKKEWKESGDYLIDTSSAELYIGKDPKEFSETLPSTLLNLITELTKKEEQPVEYLDI